MAGPIHAWSRQGRLPSVRGLNNGTVALGDGFLQAIDRHVGAGDRLPLAALQALLVDEMRRLGIDPRDILALADPPPPARTFLDREIALAESVARPWQSLGNALNAVIDGLWHLLDDAGRVVFDRTIRPVWLARRVTFPMDNARLLQRLMQGGQLTMSGGFAGVEADGDGFVMARAADAAQGAAARPEQVRVQALINATSFSCDPEPGAMPVLDALQRRRLAVTDPFGGFALDFDSGCLRRADGTIDRRISVLGSLAAGTYFWTNAMDVNARLAMGQARRLAGTLISARDPVP